MRTRIGLVFVILIVLVGISIIRRKERADFVATPKSSPPPTTEPRVPSISAARLAALAEKGPRPVEPIIDRASVDKTEVCSGEENFITVEAHSPDGLNEFLGVSVQDPATGKLLWGPRIPFRLDRQVNRPIRVVVQGKTGFQTAKIDPVKVLDCVVAHQVTIDLERTASAVDRVHLKALISEHPPSGNSPPFQPLSPSTYEWDFGDGLLATTPEAEVDHSYEAREQRTSYSSFVVTVKVHDAKGPEIRGSRAVAFPNAAFRPLALEGHVVISVGVKGGAREGRRYEPEKIWLYHGYPQPVRIEQVRVRETVLEGDHEREIFSRNYAPEQLLGFRELLPRESLTIRDLTYLQPSGADPSAVRYVEVQGHTSDGRAASGTFTLLSGKHSQPESG